MVTNGYSPSAPRRAGQLLVRTVGDHALVLDPATSRTHSLDRTATAVFTAMDGHRHVADIATAAAERLGAPVATATIEQTLAELELEGLIA